MHEFQDKNGRDRSTAVTMAASTQRRTSPAPTIVDCRAEATQQSELISIIRGSHRNRPSFAVPGAQPVQRVDWNKVEHDRIRIESEGGGRYTAYWNGDAAGELDLYEDEDGRMWINNVSSTVQGRGIGLSLLNAAVNDYGALHAAVGMTNHEEVNDEDTRHLSVEGAALVSSGVRNGILNPEWCFNPAWEGQGDDYDDDYDDEAGRYEDDDEGGHHEGSSEGGSSAEHGEPSRYEVIEMIRNGTVTHQDVMRYADDDPSEASDLYRAADRDPPNFG